MAELAIRGHAKRGKEVIEILEMLGGTMSTKLLGSEKFCGYYINSNGNIDYRHYSYLDDAIHFTLEKFLKKFPYKIGDKVIYDKEVFNVVEMMWNKNLNTISYGLYNGKRKELLTIQELQPYKEETMEEQKKEYDEWFQIDYLEFENNDDTWADEVEVNLGKDYEIQIRGDKTFIVKKQPQYPKTYEECCKILNIPLNGDIVYAGNWVYGGEYLDKHLDKIRIFQKLLICRDAYWKIAGEQMGLDKPWEPDWHNLEQDKFVIYTVFAFPTAEMRDAFLENFKELIELYKELL